MENYIYPRKSLVQLIAELQQIPNPETVGVAFLDNEDRPYLICANQKIEHCTENIMENKEWISMHQKCYTNEPEYAVVHNENPDGFTSFVFFQ